MGFVRWYNTEHRRSAIKFVTPSQRHSGQDVRTLENRERIYKAAKDCNPNQWSGDTRNWKRPVDVWLNPETKEPIVMEKLRDAA